MFAARPDAEQGRGGGRGGEPFDQRFAERKHRLSLRFCLPFCPKTDGVSFAALQREGEKAPPFLALLLAILPED